MVQIFSAWLMPNLAMFLQLPFGAQYRLDDLMSVVITIGSTVLARYSLSSSMLVGSICDLSQFTFRGLYLRQPSASLTETVFPCTLPSLVVLPDNNSW